MSKPVSVLYLGSLTHSDETNFMDRSRPHEDEIEFQAAVRVALIRIPRPGKDIYSRHISITQTQPIKNLEIWYRNLEKTSGRYSLLMASNEICPNQNDDILITPKQPIFTDFLLIKGNFTKITLCIYGNLILDQNVLAQNSPLFKANAPIELGNQTTPQSYGSYGHKDIFQQKRRIVSELEKEAVVSNSIEEWEQPLNDDGINEQQIENICSISQKLLSCSDKLSQEAFVVEFRAGLEEITAQFSKIFKNKHIGLYYPLFDDSTISTELSLDVVKVCLLSLDLSLSQKVRALDILKYVLQLDQHAKYFAQNQGVERLMKIFVEFFRVGSVVLSTYKNLLLQVLICCSHWKLACVKMTQTIKNAYYHEVFEQRSIQVEQVKQERQRSREKKPNKRSRSQSGQSQSSSQNKKKKKDKQKKRNKSREKKRGKQSKAKQQAITKKQQEKQQPPKVLSLREEVPDISFYELLMFVLAREKSIKQLLLVKVLLEQILQTMTKSKVASQRVAAVTSLLKDVKYVFNPAGEVLNTKSLKQFATTYQPFLNRVQSEGVDSEIVAERQKLKDMRKYNIDSRIVRILNRVAVDISVNQSGQMQNREGSRTPYGSEFIVMMSEVVRSRGNNVLFYLNRLLAGFKEGAGQDIVQLKRIEGAMTVLAEYIYKSLLSDSGLFTVLHIDQIYSALINISNSLSKDQSAFTKELKRKIRQLTNYAMAYDLYTSSQGNFKTISEYFLKLFKYQHYEINKISDFKKKEYEKTLLNPNIPALTQTYSTLSTFHELLPEQPLLEIDVYLKIFNIILQYNKNVWPLFYENKLVSGFNHLFNRLSGLLIFLLQSSLQRQSILTNVRKLSLTVENYLNVTLRLLKILAKKAEYEAAFNDLLDQDNFQGVQLYEKSFSTYVALFNAVHNKSSLFSPTCTQLVQQILSKILTIYDKLFQSYELTSHPSRQSKLKQLWLTLYQTHFTNINSRPACLSLFSFFAQTLQIHTAKLFVSFCLEQSLKLDIPKLHPKGHIPLNQKSIVQNLIIANIYRSDSLVQNNLTNFIKNLLDKHSQKTPLLEKITSYLENIFDEIDRKLKQKSFIIETTQDIILLQKMVLFSNVLKKLNCILTAKFEQKLIKHLKSLDSIKKYDSIGEENKIQAKSYKLSLQIKCNIILFLKKSFSEKPQHSQTLNLVQILNKNLDFSLNLEQVAKQHSLQNLPIAQLQIQKQSLKLTDSSLEMLCALSSNPYNQSVILYEVFLQNPYKPAPQISLINLFSKLTSPQFISLLASSQNEMLLENLHETMQQRNTQFFKKMFKQICIRAVYLLCLMTSIDSSQFYSTQSRRNAITCLVTDEKDFPISKLQLLKSFVPSQLIQTLKDYFAYPIIEKPLVIKTEQKKQSLRNKGYLFSKALFSIIMEGQPAAKSRYPFIGGPWKSGDLSTNFLYTPSKQRNYLKTVEKSLAIDELQELQQICGLQSKYSVLNRQKVERPLLQFNIKKRSKVVEKKQAVDTQIKSLNVPLVLENLNPVLKIDQNVGMKRVSPSPSGKYQNVPYSKGGSSYEGRVKVSPSPPSNRIPTQSIIGFNNSGQGISQQYGSQSIQNVGYSGNMIMQPGNTAQMASLQTQQVPGGVPLLQKSSSFKSQYEPMLTVGQPQIQPPTYPNPYYGSGVSHKSPSIDSQIQSSNIAMSYPQMQKVSSQQSANQIRTGSNSAPRSNGSFNGMAYQPQQQPFYPPNQSYMGAGTGPKMGGYNDRSHSPYYHKNYSQNFNNQRNQYQQGGFYSGSQDRGMAPGYTTNYNNQPMMGNPRQAGFNSQQIPNRQPYKNPNQYGNFDYQARNMPIGQNYPPANFVQPGFNLAQQAQQDERQFNDAILLVTELRGTLPEHLKNDKKNRLNQILHNNLRVQNRVKEYINNLK